MLFSMTFLTTFTEPRHLAEVPAQVVALLRRIDLAQGRLGRLTADAPVVADALATKSRIESVIASNEMEGVGTAPRRAEQIALARIEPVGRDEMELAGYRSALDDIFRRPDDVVGVPRLLHWHRELFRHAGPDVAGRLKTQENRVANPDGTDRFRTVSARLTPMALDALVDGAEDAYRQGVHHPVLITAVFVLDLLVIHPFEDGNGRTARIATNAWLTRAGYEVGRFVSIEQMVADRRAAYYVSLRVSTEGWHDGNHSVWPWTTYFAEVVADAYAKLDARLSGAVLPDQRSLVESWLATAAPGTFSMGDALRELAGVAPGTVRAVLNAARARGALSLRGSGRGARWVIEDRARVAAGRPR